MGNVVSQHMQTIQLNQPANHHRNAARRLFTVLVLAVGMGALGLAGCASTSQRASTNNKPGNNAPHEERNPSQHPEQFR